MEFFKKVLGEEKGWVPLIRLGSEGKPNLTKWFEWPKQMFQMAQYIDQYAGEDVYFSPMLYTEPDDKTDPRHAAKRNVTYCRVVWADADTADPTVFTAKPSIVVETSPKRYHTYWVLDDAPNPVTCEELSHSVADAHKADGVDRGWGLSKRLRVPGTMNTKSTPFLVHELSLTDISYTTDEFAADYPPVESIKVSDADIPTGLPAPETLLNQLPFNALVQKLFYEEPTGDRSTALHTLEMLLFEQGLSAAEVYGIVRGARCNKFADPGRTEDELWRHVLSAEGKHQQNQAAIPDQEDIEEISEKFSQETWEKLDLLTKEEREDLPRTFIDEYADWGKAQSARSARQYHEASAWTILSTVFSEFGHVLPSWGNTPLNLYFLVLGQTTRSRKSTAKNMMIRVLERLSDPDLGYDYDLGSDATPEALTEALSERPSKSSLFWRDEVQALFAHAASGSYTAGLLPMLTDAYDGQVNGVLRKTGNKKRTKRTKTNLIFYGMGIVTQVAQALRDDDFYSGFLPRVLWVVDLQGDKQYGSTDVIQRTDDKIKRVDVVFEEMCKRLELARKFWQSWKNRSGGGTETYGIPATEEAWARWQKMTVDIERLADAHPTRSDVLAPGAQRLGVSALKAAALLAMLDKSQEIRLDHMVTAIRYATEWAKYMEYMARQVSKSKLMHDSEVLMELILSSTKPVPYGKALAHFKGEKNVRDFNELIEYMVNVGMIMVDTKGSRKSLVAR